LLSHHIKKFLSDILFYLAKVKIKKHHKTKCVVEIQNKSSHIWILHNSIKGVIFIYIYIYIINKEKNFTCKKKKL
jgi:hypothetical protein